MYTFNVPWHVQSMLGWVYEAQGKEMSNQSVAYLNQACLVDAEGHSMCT